MTEVLTWSVDLGHWFGVRVRVHYFLFIFALWMLLSAAVNGRPLAPTLAWLLILVAVLALHELGHALMARWHDIEPDEVRLWPLGSLTIPGPIRVSDSVAVAAAGMLTSAGLAIASAFVLRLFGADMVFHPFGHYDPKASLVDPGAPTWLTTGAQVAPYGPLWVLGWFGHLNWVVFLANGFIPAYPFDAGRIFRTVMARSAIGLTRDNPYTQWTARGLAGILGVVGLYESFVGPPNVGWALFILAVLIELIVRTEVLMIEQEGFFDDGIFGYDFSAGYTSLESSSPQVRPAREGTLKRWRRRRSEARVRRRTEREAAQEHRLDEILDKLHRQGRAALSDDEQRFLVQASSRLRNKSRADG